MAPFRAKSNQGTNSKIPADPKWRLTNLTNFHPEKTDEPSSKPERNFIRRSSRSVAGGAPGSTSSAIVTDEEHNLDIDIKLPTLYKSELRFAGSPPSPAPTRPPERNEADGTAAGSHDLPSVSPLPPLSTVELRG